ncbi:metallophosphoesterase [Marinimicrobium agarilyticum]|uniref:metallophosphoesterase n=1 Tax=Marinimicrobium agarilyticum TaxID=306546 RepID=UPI000487A536|nr:metallophosphoesterase [Marinimicrobium agarilyticum]
MKLAAASDLHLEFSQANRSNALAFPTDTDVIVLAGDIGVGKQSVQIALDLSVQFPSSHIVWIAGNHEFYNHNIDHQIEEYRSACEGNKRVHFLENDSIVIDSVKFVGCTLWTDFSVLGESDRAMYVANRGINDFRLIRTRKDDRFTPEDAAEKFKESTAYLKKELSNSEPEQAVVITHFPPGLKTHNKKYPLDNMAAYFQANVDYIINEYQPALWIYGHNHCSKDIRNGVTRLVSNQLGYPSELGHIPRYNPSETINLD